MAGAALLSAACGNASIELGYKFPLHRDTSYRWTIDATTEVDSPSERSTHDLRFVIDARETFVKPTAVGGALMQLTLDPISRTEDGVSLPPGAPVVTLDLDVRPDGTIKGTAVPATIGIGIQLDRLLAEALPRLPNRAMRIGESWNAPLVVKSDDTSIDLKGSGRLVGFNLRDRRRLALIRIKRNGEVTSVQRVGRAPLTVAGTSKLTTNAEIDTDEGMLVSLWTRSDSKFDLSAGSAPAGTRHIVVVTRVRLL